jgi:imidazole glycerol-phosphate synthase subunit HisF
MPCLLLMNKGLYKTVKYKDPNYVGDPINAIKIYNEKEVDELIFLDITASIEGRKPDYKIIKDIASECFMPLCYGGGITHLDEVKRILEIGVEKVSLNTAAIDHPKLITEIANSFGSQSVIVSMDVRKNFWGKQEVYRARGTKSIGEDPVSFAKKMESMGAGELLVTNVDREGTWSGFDLDLIKSITSEVSIPVIVNGGAGNLSHLESVVKDAHASAVALGSMVVYQKKGLGVLINFPKRNELEILLN